MLTDTIIEDPRWAETGFSDLAETAAQTTLRHLSINPGHFEIAVLACDDARVATLNADFRGKPTPTNVLSWPEQDLAPIAPGATPDMPRQTHAGEPHHLGDIALAYDTCLREAGEQNKSFQDHVTHLIVHGVLHLLGYDHIRDKDATLMEGHERAILGKMGLSDPYFN